MNTLIKLKNIIKEFKNGDNLVRVLDDINLEIQKGEFVSIIGSSGSGKSTLMNILGCLDKASFGEYLVNGQEVKDLTKDELASLRRVHFGFIFQKYHLINSISSIENVQIPAIYDGVNKETRYKKALKLLKQLGLEGKEKHKPNELSGGQQQRVSIARSLMNGGEVILADEPTGALDSKNGKQVMELLKQLHKEGHTIIIVTHDPNIAIQTQRIIEISDGKIIKDEKNIPILKEDEVLEDEGQIIPNEAHLQKSYFSFTNNFKEAFSMALKAILSHKIRSFLTMLGIIIGIASVVSVVALGQGSKEKILNNINSMGTNTIDIYPGEGWGDRNASKIKTLSERDINVLREQPYVDSISANVSGSKNIIYKSENVTSQIMGVSPDYFRVKAMSFAKGKEFNNNDIKYQSQYVVIDSNTEDKLFKNINPIGEILIVGNVPLKVIGVLEDKKSAFGGQSDSLKIFVPYTTAMYRMFGTNTLGSITVRIKDGVNTQIAENGITSLLTRNHGGKQDFFTSNLDTIKQTIEETTATMTLLISAIAIISLVVGGIGVMNIMLVSVIERTKEIGVRMAIGARQFDIMQQFLIEAVLVCLIGGLLGIALSMGIGVLFNSISTNFGMIYSANSIITAFVCSSLIGIIFGFIPAKNAAKLDPIVALAQE